MGYQQMSFLREPELEKACLPVFQGASHASRIRLQECVRHLVMNVTCGRSSGESLAKLSPDGLWLRMFGDCFQANLEGFFEEYSGIFPTWGMMLDGVVTGLQTSEQFIPEREYIEAYGQTMDPVERARKFAVKCWMGFGCGNLYRNGFKSGQQAHSPNPAKSWAGLPETMELAAERLRGVQIECLPALELIKRYDTPDVLIYADPPYLHGTRKNYLYRHEMTDEEHKELLKIPDFILTRVEAIKASSTKTSSRLI